MPQLVYLFIYFIYLFIYYVAYYFSTTKHVFTVNVFKFASSRLHQWCKAYMKKCANRLSHGRSSERHGYTPPPPHPPYLLQGPMRLTTSPVAQMERMFGTGGEIYLGKENLFDVRGTLRVTLIHVIHGRSL